MKKFLTLLFALVLALALTVPAMAFTDTAKADKDPIELDVYLVEYEDDEFFGLTGMPPSDRGYAKNEIVAAMCEITVPKGIDPAEDYEAIDISGDNVSFNLYENKVIRTSSNVGSVDDFVPNTSGTLADGGSYGLIVNDTFAKAANKAQTFKFLFFAKITGDDASITVTLEAEGEGFNNNDETETLDYEGYTITKVSDDDYLISEDDGGDELFTIFTDDGESEGLELYLDGEEYTVVDRASGIGFIGLKKNGDTGLLDKDDDKAIYRELMEIYDDVFVDVFGFDFDKMGGIVDDDTFLDLVGSDDISATVEIKPWTAYVSVPDAIVIDPPKTGDAASILGLVMIVLAAAAVVAVKKVRA